MSLVKESLLLPLSRRFWVPLVGYGVAFFLFDRVLEFFQFKPVSLAMEAIWLIAYLHGLSDLIEVRQSRR